jgi:hypothetical protein
MDPPDLSYLKSPIITLQVGTPPAETILSAHLALLQTSPWFAESCASYSASTPIAERLIILPDEDLEAVGAFLEFLYTNEYTPRLVPSSSGKPEDMVLEGAGNADIDEGGDHLLKHARVYTLAEKLQLPDLKHLAHSKIHRINSTAKGELRYAMFVYQNTSREDKTIRQPIASFWAHRSRFSPLLCTPFSHYIPLRVQALKPYQSPDCEELKASRSLFDADYISQATSFATKPKKNSATWFSSSPSLRMISSLLCWTRRRRVKTASIIRRRSCSIRLHLQEIIQIILRAHIKH